MKTIQLHDKDNVLVALQDLVVQEHIHVEGNDYILLEDIPAKHKFFIRDLLAGEYVIMYGVVIGKVQENVKKGQRMTTENTKHSTESYTYRGFTNMWQSPDIEKFKDKRFMGYHRTDGRVGTANYWLFIPTVFCENRNIDVIQQALISNLGYGTTDKYQVFTKSLVDAYQNAEDIRKVDISLAPQTYSNRIFKNIDGIKFLTHQGGCGGTRQDAVVLAKLFASYIDHPNVAGATILGLGCENLQMSQLMDELYKRNPSFDKPLLSFEQQQIGREEDLIQEAISKTFLQLIEANKIERQPAALDKLVLGVKCGGSDGFSGISANPAVGYTSDLLVALGGSVLLAEFPELCGAEQQILDRIKNADAASKFMQLMQNYSAAAEKAGSGFHMNPSPGNIRDGLITDAMKSNGAAKKGGSSPIVDVLDYTEPIRHQGLNLVCTPGNDVEATTGKAASGATLILFTTGLGTPTGNPICPTIKVATNDNLTKKMPDIIDINTGSIINGTQTVESMGEDILTYCIKAASGEIIPKAVLLNQDDFIPWKRGVSL